MIRKLVFALLIAAGFHTAAQALPVSDRPDHSILVTIQSEPSGAEIWTVPVGDDEEAFKVGTTPHVAVVELHWGRGFLGMNKKWRKLEVQTVGDLCASTYDKEDKSYELALSFELRKEGFESQRVEQPLSSFAYYKDLDWDNIEGIASRKSFSYNMAPEAGRAGDKTVRKPASTIMLAGAGDGDEKYFSTLNIDSLPAGAAISVDSQSVGPAPVRVIVRAGDHEVEATLEGWPTRKLPVKLNPATETSVRIELKDPAAP